MFLLAENVLPLIDTELKEMIAKNEQISHSYKKPSIICK
jgi:hypothetical protein